MTVASAVENQTVLAFDSLAGKYDELFTRSLIGRAQRGAVWDVLLDIFEPGSHILELNCGTGEDALFLARHDCSVVACDASGQMIQTARQRMQSEDPDASDRVQASTDGATVEASSWRVVRRGIF